MVVKDIKEKDLKAKKKTIEKWKQKTQNLGNIK